MILVGTLTNKSNKDGYLLSRPCRSVAMKLATPSFSPLLIYVSVSATQEDEGERAFDQSGVDLESWAAIGL